MKDWTEEAKALSEPVTKLIEVVAQGVGGWFRPHGIVRMAKAEAKAALIMADSDSQLQTIRNRIRSSHEHMPNTRVENVENIAIKTVEYLPESVSDKSLNRDWIAQYFRRAQDVHDDEMQEVWAKILAGELTEPGSFNRRSLQILETLEKWEADSFTKVCSLSITLDSGRLMFLENGATLRVLEHEISERNHIEQLITVGLLAPNLVSIGASDIDGIEATYFDEKIAFSGPPYPDQSAGKAKRLQLVVGGRNFTEEGRQLSHICGAAPYREYVKKLSEHLSAEVDVTVRQVNA